MKIYNKMTSEELNSIQKYLTAKLEECLKYYDFEGAGKLIKELAPLDIKRRKAWHREKFGPYNKLAREALKQHKQNVKEDHFDDIPF